MMINLKACIVVFLVVFGLQAAPVPPAKKVAADQAAPAPRAKKAANDEVSPVPHVNKAALHLASYSHCRDELSDGECSENAHLCYLDSEYTANCVKTCGLCEGRDEPEEPAGLFSNEIARELASHDHCRDQLTEDECAKDVDLCYADSVYTAKCLMTCGLCEGRREAAEEFYANKVAHILASHDHCRDKLEDDKCSERAHFCFKDSEYTANCVMTCGLCEGRDEPKDDDDFANKLANKLASHSHCHDELDEDECVEFAHLCFEDDDYTTKCQLTCGICEGRDEAEDVSDAKPNARKNQG